MPDRTERAQAVDPRGHSPEQEAFLAIVRTAAQLTDQIEQVLRPEGIGIAQYNVLRILRGAGEAGLPTLAIRDRMIEEAAGITRLLDRLEVAAFVVRERCTPDRRQVLCRITPPGLALLASLDAPVEEVNTRAVAALTVDEQRNLVTLLGAVRGGDAGDAQRTARVGQPPR